MSIYLGTVKMSGSAGIAGGDASVIASNITLSTTAQPYITINNSSKTIALPATDPYTSARTPVSHAHGQLTNDGKITSTSVALASGDSLVFVDSSDSSKIKKTSITFDGSTTTKYLSQAGTWVDAPTVSYTPTVTSSTTGAYVIGTLTINGSNTTIYGKDTTSEGGGGTSDGNYYPTAVTWLSGVAAGPKPKLTMIGVEDITGDSIPPASSSASGIVTARAQTFAGVKTFASSPKLSTNAITTSGGYTQTFPDANGYIVNGAGGSGYLTQWSDTNTITVGPQFGNSTTTFLRNDGRWEIPSGGGGGAEFNQVTAVYDSTAQLQGCSLYRANCTGNKRNFIIISLLSSHFPQGEELIVYLDNAVPYTDNYILIDNGTGNPQVWCPDALAIFDSSTNHLNDFILLPADSNGNNATDIPVGYSLWGVVNVGFGGGGNAAVLTFGGRFNEV